MSKGTFSRRMQAKTYIGIKLKPLRIKQNKNFPEKKIRFLTNISTMSI